MLWRQLAQSPRCGVRRRGSAAARESRVCVRRVHGTKHDAHDGDDIQAVEKLQAAAPITLRGDLRGRALDVKLAVTSTPPRPRAPRARDEPSADAASTRHGNADGFDARILGADAHAQAIKKLSSINRPSGKSPSCAPRQCTNTSQARPPHRLNIQGPLCDLSQRGQGS